MPLKRTPPSTSKTTHISDTEGITAAKDTDIEVPKTGPSRTRSRKRAHDDELSMSISEVRNIVAELKHEQNNRLDELQTTIQDIKRQNIGIIESIEHLSKEYEDIKKQLESIERERKNNFEYIQTLETKIESLEKSQRSSSVEIKNIPPMKGETKEDLLKLAIKVGQTVKQPIQTSDIRDIFRLNTKSDEYKPIIVGFTTVLLKEKLMEKCKMFNKQHRDNRLNTSHLHFVGPPKNIFITDNLTSKSKRLFFLARDFANINNYAFCWTAHGKVYIRKKEGAKHWRIDSDADLDKLKSELKL